MRTLTQYQSWIFGICRRAARAALTLAIALAPAVALNGSSQAQGFYYGVLYSFTGGADGAYPMAGLVQDAQGNLYGTTNGGGAYGAGTVFKIDPTGKESVVYTFKGSPDGANPWAGVVLDSQGNLYGTTWGGGTSGAGTVFKVDPSGNETLLHSFTNIPDGASPRAGVVLDAQGNLYGTTSGGGGPEGYGTVFKVDPSGNESVLHSFDDPYPSSDGIWPFSGLVADGQGNFFGTTEWGGAKGRGTVYVVDSIGNETVLYSFGTTKGNGPDGDAPYGGLVLDNGYLLGTTYYGGIHNKGVAFFIMAYGGYPEEDILYFFGKGGSYPCATLVLDPVSGDLYGTAWEGGTGAKGTVFGLNQYVGSEWVLHNFNGKKGDGADPYGGLVLATQPNGLPNLYGTTDGGGAYGYGTVFTLLNSAAATTTTLTSAPNPSGVGQPVIFTAVVSGSQGAPPDGEAVTFINFKTVLGTATLSGGSASLTTSSLKKGTRPVTAVYAGDTLFAGSTSNTVNQVVTK